MSITYILKSKNLQNSAWIIGEQLFQMLISLIVGIFSARYLGPENYGTLNYTASFVAFFSSIATLSMDGVLIKKLISKPNKEGCYLGGCMILRFFASLISIISISIIVYILNPNNLTKLAMAGIQSLQLVFLSVQILDSWFQRHLKSRYVSIGKMIACIIVSAYKIFLLVTSKSVLWFALSTSLSDLTVSIFLFAFYKKEQSQKLLFDIERGIEVLKESYHFILSGIMVALYSQMDKIMIGQMLSDAYVGLYTTATALCSMWFFVPTAIINSFRPLIMELKESNNQSTYLLRLKQLYSAVIWLCICVSICIMPISSIIIKMLYGEAYLGASKTLQIAIWYGTFAMIGTARGIWIVCENKNRYVKYYLAIGAIVNLVLNTVMIPVWGIEGAAIATLLTQITTSLVAPTIFKETRIHSKIVLDAFCLNWYFQKGR